jgi:thiaminase
MNTFRDLYIDNSGKYNPLESAQNHLLMIGIDEYPNGFKPLKNAVRDIETINKILTEKYVFNGKTIMLRNSEASREAIYNIFYTLLQEQTEKDNLLIYYAGHSGLDDYSNGFWIPYDAISNEPKQRFDSYIDTSFIQRSLRQMKSKHICLFSDSCYSYDLFPEFDTRNIDISNNENFRSRHGFYSGRREVSDGYINSPFAKAIIDYLSNQIVDFDITEMAVNVAKKMSLSAENDSQEPKCEPIPHTRHEKGSFKFRLKESNEELQLLRNMQLSPSTELFNLYMEKYGKDGKYFNFMKNEKSKLDFIGNIEEIWADTRSQNTIPAYESFIDLYGGFHTLAIEARKRIEAVKRKEKKQAEQTKKKIEQQDWEKALLEVDAHLFEQYLEKYPKGIFRKKAEELLNTIFLSNKSSDSLRNLVPAKLDSTDVYEEFQKITQACMSRYPNPVLYTLMCESIINEAKRNRNPNL